MTDRYYYESLHINGSANTEVVEEILISTEEEPKYVDAITFIENTSTERHDAEIMAYIEREKIMDVPICINLIGFDYDGRLGTDLWYPLGHKLPVGQSLRIGHVSGSIASNVWYTVRYQIEE